MTATLCIWMPLCHATDQVQACDCDFKIMQGLETKYERMKSLAEQVQGTSSKKLLAMLDSTLQCLEYRKKHNFYCGAARIVLYFDGVNIRSVLSMISYATYVRQSSYAMSQFIRIRFLRFGRIAKLHGTPQGRKFVQISLYFHVQF